MPLPESAAAYIEQQKQRLRSSGKRPVIVFPEGGDPRVQAAAGRLAAEGLLTPVLVGKPPLNPPQGIRWSDPEDSDRVDRLATIYYERRRAKGVLRQEAAEAARHPMRFGALMVTAGEADGAVGSAVYTTAETVRAFLQCIGLKTEFRRLSSMHLMGVRDESYGHRGLLGFSDAAIMVDPTPPELAEIAIASAGTYRQLTGATPNVALLSFSTKGSARHPRAEKVIEAMRYVRERAPDLNCDGELQADAALVPSVGQSKAKGSPAAGYANVLIFPNLDAANIGYKLVERLGGAALIAVILQGLEKPANLISRGCNADDAYHCAIVTAVQTLK
ncbi:MAG: phosphotransacetylase [Bryobacterales bacterium]|nr:phosphotransacetylase [Bryobacterales bacterium]